MSFLYKIPDGVDDRKEEKGSDKAKRHTKAISKLRGKPPLFFGLEYRDVYENRDSGVAKRREVDVI